LALLTYRLLLILLLPVVLIIALVRSISQKAYRQRLSERLGFIPSSFKAGGIVIHAASVGEVLALKPFIEQCITTFNSVPITVTTFTPTGSEQVQKLFGNKIQHCYLPLDILPCSFLFLRKLKPKALILMETELWPNLIAQARKQNTKLLLINGRISNKSLPRYQKLSALIKPCLQRFDFILAQSQDNADRLIQLGANTNKCVNVGNLKYDLKHSDDTAKKQQALSSILPQNRPTWLLASSHEGDEVLIIKSYKQLIKRIPNALLIIVPRHPERFDAVAKLLSKNNISFQRRSEKCPVNNETQAWLLDSLGELMAVLSFANVVTMGGSFSTVGGHNPLEPALYKKPVVVGADMSNFTEVFEQLKQVSGIIALTSSNENEQLINEQADTISTLLLHPQKAINIGENAYLVVQNNQGATQRSVAILQELLNH